ncbi:MAG: hypothetical protein QM723_17050 [Myxococcaceae bacterium]
MTLAVALALTLAAAPKVMIADGDHEGVAPNRVSELSSDVRARCATARLEVVGADAACESPGKCVPKAEKAGADAFIVVSLFAGPKGVTVDLDARKADGSKLEVFTVNLPPSAHALPDEAAAFFGRIAKRLTPEEAPKVVSLLPPPRETVPVVETPASPSVRSRAWIPLVPAAVFAVTGAALLINAAVIDGQIRGGAATFTDDPSQTRSRLDSAVSAGKLSQGLGYAGLGLAVGCLAVSVVMYLLGAPVEPEAVAVRWP